MNTLLKVLTLSIIEVISFSYFLNGSYKGKIHIEQVFGEGPVLNSDIY